MKNQAVTLLVLGILVIIFALLGGVLAKAGNIILGIIVAAIGFSGMKKK
jgi:uncharacterized membrane protein YccC